MGSRGLGQLAYNKGAQILAASQAEGVAIESAQIRMGLLTHVLVEEAPRHAGRGAHSINDMSLREWLEYAVERVPAVYRESRARTVAPAAGENDRGLTLIEDDAATPKAPAYQRPVLFDFTVKSREIPLIPGYRTNLANAAVKELAEAEQALARGTSEDAKGAVKQFQSIFVLAWQAEDDRLMAAAQQGLARAYRRLGDRIQATEVYGSAAALWEHAEDRRAQAGILDELGEFHDSEGDSAQALERYSEALTLARAVGDREFEGRVVTRIARVYRRAGEGEIAIILASRALGRLGRTAGLLRERGLAYESIKNKAKASADLEEVLAIDPRDVESLVGRGNLRRDDKNHAAAVADYTKALEVDPKSTSALYERAWTYHLKGEEIRAIADFDILIRRDPGFASAYRERGDALRAKGDLDRAIADYTKALEIDPKHDRAYTGRGRARLRKKDWDSALSDFEQAARLQPDRPEPYLDLARSQSVRADSKVVGEESEARRALIAKALDLLEKMATMGYQDWEKVREDEEFRVLRDEPRFRKLILKKTHPR
jgi:tetratricopeptide (TPR) repeat protein